MNSKLLQGVRSFFVKNEVGEFEIRWPQIIPFLILIVVSSIAGQFVLSYLTGMPFRPIRVAFIIFPSVLSVAWILILLRNKANGQSIWRFNLRSLLGAITAACVFWTLAVLDRQSEVEIRTERAKLESQILEIVGDGEVSVSGTPGSTFIQVQRASFNDQDLEAILQLRNRLEEVYAPIVFLDFSSTNITDNGASMLLSLDSLKQCYLNLDNLSEHTLEKIRHHVEQ